MTPLPLTSIIFLILANALSLFIFIVFIVYYSIAVTALNFGPCVQSHNNPSSKAVWSPPMTAAPNNNTTSSSSSVLPNQSHLLALGSEIGDISYWEIQTNNASSPSSSLSSSPPSSSSSITSSFIQITSVGDAHGAAVKCVVFSPVDKTTWPVEDVNELTGCVRVYFFFWISTTPLIHPSPHLLSYLPTHTPFPTPPLLRTFSHSSISFMW